MSEILSLPEGVTLVESKEKSLSEIAENLISERKVVVVAGLDYADFRRKAWILQATDFDPDTNALKGYKGWQYKDNGTFGFVDTDAGEYGDNIDFPEIVFFVAEMDERLLDKTADQAEVMTVIDYALIHVTDGPPGSGFTSV